ncbi:MAG TPA: hypothetical protein VHB21_20870 [Minicystis sp.]|nr:hypothetical protein [Minicystis sp.]
MWPRRRVRTPWRPARPFALFAAACATALALAAPRDARAEPTARELAAARQTFGEGKDLEKAGDWAGALEKFKKVAEVKITPQVRFHIALCEENLGRYVSALKGFDLAAEEARLAGSSAIEVAENAPGRAEALRKKVAHLTIAVTGKLVTSKLSLDGVELTSEKIGKDQLVDPGKHRVLLQTRDAPVFDKDIELAPGESQTIRVEVHDEAPPPESPPPGTPAPPPAPPSRAPAYVIGGIGVAALAGGGVLMGLAQVAKADVESHCTNDRNCPRSFKSEGDRGRTFYYTSFVVGGAGAAALATGAVLFVVLAPKKTHPKTGAALVVAPTLGGVTASGTF